MKKYFFLIALCLSLLLSSFCIAEAAVDNCSLLLTGVGNARELGGYTTEDGRTVKHGALLRTAKLADATEEDIQRLLTVYRLAVDVDFRGDGEVESAPDPEMEGVEYQNIHIMDESSGPPEELEAEIKTLEEQGIEVWTGLPRCACSPNMALSLTRCMWISFPPMRARPGTVGSFRHYWRCRKTGPFCSIAPRERTGRAADPC